MVDVGYYSFLGFNVIANFEKNYVLIFNISLDLVGLEKKNKKSFEEFIEFKDRILFQIVETFYFAK
ncbi:MAG: hypothetical protein KatS3mg097_047 [Candidatus Parcubacteria bacterium]|nr:MAG: hypothetical protein KatS3mg097_047 [Candidatus Parcubacteria bacterium]